MKPPSTPGSWLHHVGLRQIPMIAWLALAVSLAATAGAWLFASRQIRYQIHLRLQHELDQGVAKLRERLLLCESVVHGAQGLYAASKSIERREWQVYGQGLFGEKQYPPNGFTRRAPARI